MGSGRPRAQGMPAALMSARAGANGITYAAVTATPKAKTLALTGRRPDPNRQHDQPAQSVPRLFYAAGHRERVILDVLKNYTPYSLAFRLAGDGKAIDEKEVERDEAVAATVGSSSCSAQRIK